MFFIGVAFTCEALLWSLANPAATLTGFGIFTLTTAFFTLTDKKRAFKTSCFGTAGILVFLAALMRIENAPNSFLVGVLGLVAAIGGAIIIRQHGVSKGARTAASIARRQTSSVEDSKTERSQAFDSTPEGLSDLTYPHIEPLGHRGSRIVYHAPELEVAEDPRSGLVMFKISSIFADTSSVLIGCGTPNLATSVYDNAASKWKRLSGFMLYREPSHVAVLDELQIGVYFELRGLSDEVRMRLLASVEAHSGVRAPSCAHLNAKVLVAAGFSLGGGGGDITRVVRPSKLASLIWRFGLEHDGVPVDIRVVNTSPIEVSDHFVGVWRKEVNSPVRLVQKALKPKRAAGSVGVPSQSVVVRSRQPWTGRPLTLWVNRPTMLGWLLTVLWGRHAEYKVAIPGLQHVPDLVTPLASFPGQLSWVTKAKKHILFSKPVVAFINRIKNKTFERYDNVPVDAALEMLSPVSAATGKRVLWNFALVLADDGYEIRLSPLKNLDPLSQKSRLRRTSNWILAKHVVATGYHPATVYAGEAWVQKDSNNGGLTLFVNDNSGTYKPTSKQLDAVGKLFGSLGLDVRVMPHSPTLATAHNVALALS